MGKRAKVAQMVQGWGNFPRLDGQLISPAWPTDCPSLLQRDAGPIITRGMGRSYGDSALAEQMLSTTLLNRFIAFDRTSGLLECESGMTLHEILQLVMPHGWCLQVTPGTGFVSLGGAIASDVHGKNHHHAGTFSQYVKSIKLLLGNGEVMDTTPDIEPALFYATCGGMGLTGVILSAVISLKKIFSHRIEQTTLRLPHLNALLEAFERHQHATYSVAWIDCLSSGSRLGRAVLLLGEHDTSGILETEGTLPRPLVLPLPSVLLNRYSVKLFNSLHYWKAATVPERTQVGFRTYFYPLDKIHAWNRFYGKAGFLQYQCVIPEPLATQGMTEVLRHIVDSGKASFLAVLKQFGPQNQNYLSFPVKGLSLALDFKLDSTVLALLDKLDTIVLAYGGRVYLCKDARMTEQTFKASYPAWAAFEAVREQYRAIGKFSSLQSRRLGLR